jgi:hypothetical protein
MMTFKLDKPLTVGDLQHQFVVDELTVGSLFLDFHEQFPVLTVALVHKPSGWNQSVSYRDAGVLDFHNANDYSALLKAVFAKLIDDGKLPTGNVT